MAEEEHQGYGLGYRRIVPHVVVVGSANVDFVWSGPRLPVPGETVSDGTFTKVFGGKGANQAAAAARLGAAVTFVGCVGDDDIGAALRDDLIASGVDCTHLATDPGAATGVALITVAADGENMIAVAPGANRCVTMEQIDTAIAAAHADVLLTGFEIGIATTAMALRAARRYGTPTICNPSPVDRTATSLFQHCDVVIVNALEADTYGGADAILAAGAGRVVVTLGGAGATAITAITATTAIDTTNAVGTIADPGYDVAVVDTTGAGDAFGAAYAVRPDLAFACAAGALACRAIGARGSQATLADITDLFTAQPRSTR